MSGTITHTTPVNLTITAATPAAMLTGAVATPTGSVQLTTEGTKDWAHWGLTSVSSFDQKAGVNAFYFFAHGITLFVACFADIMHQHDRLLRK